MTRRSKLDCMSRRYVSELTIRVVAALIRLPGAGLQVSGESAASRPRAPC